MAILQVRLYWCKNHNWTDHMQQLTFNISTTASTPPAVMPQLERSTLCMLVSNLVAWQISWQPSSPIGLWHREICWSDLQLCMPCNHTGMGDDILLMGQQHNPQQQNLNTEQPIPEQKVPVYHLQQCVSDCLVLPNPYKVPLILWTPRQHYVNLGTLDP